MNRSSPAAATSSHHVNLPANLTCYSPRSEMFYSVAQMMLYHLLFVLYNTVQCYNICRVDYLESSLLGTASLIRPANEDVLELTIYV